MPRAYEEVAVDNGRYAVLKKLGKGSYGTVYLVRNKADGSCCCMKKMSLKAMGHVERERALQEARLLAELKHPNIVAYVDSVVIKSKLHLFMQYCEGGDLDQRLKTMKRDGVRVPEALVLDWGSQMAFALAYLHERKILHRDLKAANVFLTGSGVVKLGDFGVSRVLSQTLELASTFVGTPYYLSPELLSNQPYNAMSDVWAFGCIVYEMCTYRHPFEAHDFPSLAREILNSEPLPLPREQYSAALARLVDGLLIKEPSERLGLADVLDAPIVRARMAQFVHEFASPPPADGAAPAPAVPMSPSARLLAGSWSKPEAGAVVAPVGAEAAPAPTAGGTSADAPRPAAKKTLVAAQRRPPPAPAAPAQPPPARERAAEPAAPEPVEVELAAEGEALLALAPAPARVRAHRAQQLAAAGDSSEQLAAQREAELLAEIEAEKARLQQKVAVLEAEHRRVAQQQQQASSLRAFQRKLESTDRLSPQGDESAAPAPAEPRAPADAARAADADFGGGAGRTPDAADGAGEPLAAEADRFYPVAPGPAPPSGFERTLDGPTAVLGAHAAAHAPPGVSAAGTGTWTATSGGDNSLDGSSALGAGDTAEGPRTLERTLDAGDLRIDLALQATLGSADGAPGAHPPSALSAAPTAPSGQSAPAEPPTRSLWEWEACFEPSEDGSGLRRSLSRHRHAHAPPSAHAHAAAAPAHPSAHAAAPAAAAPPEPRERVEGAEEKYESDFEAYYSSVYEEDEGEAGAEAGAASEAGAQRAAEDAAADAELEAGALRATVGAEGEGVSALTRTLRELQLETARKSAEQQDLEHLVQTASVYYGALADPRQPMLA